MPITETTETSVTVRQPVALPPGRVYEAFTTPEQLEDWQSGDGFTVDVHDLDTEAGGDVSITHVNEEGQFTFAGTVEAAEHAECFVHTWELVDAAVPVPGADAETTITIEFVPGDRGTEVVFTHDGLEPELVEETAAGWEWILGQLDELE